MPKNPLASNVLRLSLLAAIAAAFALALITAIPTRAFAGEEGFVFDRADAYEEADAPTLYSTGAARASGLVPMTLSDEMKYFARFESSADYDKGLSAGDGYNAMGFYQFDRRYTLKSFMLACYEYDSSKYSMFAQFKDTDFANKAVRKDGKFTDFGEALNAAWHAAYAADPEEFSALQDAWGYKEYYLVAQNYLDSKGIQIQDRRDCLKGLCWSLCNLFGSGGWQKFVTGSGVNNSMSDAEFVARLGHYVINNVSSYTYGNSYKNRYEKELAICLEYLGIPADVDPRDWYYTQGYYEFVASNGIMVGDDKGLFNPYKSVTRAQLATILYRYDQNKTADNTNNQVSTAYSDVKAGSWYAAAVKWASDNGVVKGYPGGIFKPNQVISRQELATMIARYASLKAGSYDQSGELEILDASENVFVGIAGHDEVASWARESMVWCAATGIITGVGANGTAYLMPEETADRASITKIITKIAKLTE